jgi:hypothetical protein
MSNESKSAPTKFRGDHGLCVNLWENLTDKGIFYSVKIERSYKDGDDWKTTDSVPGDQIQNLRKLLDQADEERLARISKKKAA